MRLDIYDFNGRKVKTISNSISNSSYSNSEFVWDGSTDGGMSLHTGVYICKLTAVNSSTKEESTISTQMVLIK